MVPETTENNKMKSNLNDFPTLGLTPRSTQDGKKVVTLLHVSLSLFVSFLLAVFVIPYTNNLRCESRLFYAACGRIPQQSKPPICSNDVETNEK